MLLSAFFKKIQYVIITNIIITMIIVTITIISIIIVYCINPSMKIQSSLSQEGHWLGHKNSSSGPLYFMTLFLIQFCFVVAAFFNSSCVSNWLESENLNESLLTYDMTQSNLSHCDMSHLYKLPSDEYFTWVYICSHLPVMISFGLVDSWECLLTWCTEYTYFSVAWRPQRP